MHTKTYNRSLKNFDFDIACVVLPYKGGSERQHNTGACRLLHAGRRHSILLESAARVFSTNYHLSFVEFSLPQATKP